MSILLNNKLLFVASGLNSPAFYNIDKDLKFLGYSTFEDSNRLNRTVTFRVLSNNEILFSMNKYECFPDNNCQGIVVTDTNLNIKILI